MKMKLNKRAMFTYILVTMTGFCFAACNNNNKNEEAEQPVPTVIAQEETTSLPEQTVNNVVFKDKDGKTVSLSSLKGKVVFINFWATWCSPCIHEMPSINELRKTFKDNKDLVFLMVDVDGNIEKSKEWMKKKKFDLPVHVPDSEIPRELFAGSIPTTIIVDKQNNIIGRQVGGADYSSKEVINLLTKLLNEK